MVQSIGQTQAAKSLQGISYEQLNGNYQKTAPMKEDSFKGKTLLTLATITGAILFRKQIGNAVKKYLPNVANFISNKILTPIKNFSTIHKNNIVVKTLRKGQAMFLKAEKATHKFLKNTCNNIAQKFKPNTMNLLPETTVNTVAAKPTRVTYSVVGAPPENLNFIVKAGGNGKYSWVVPIKDSI